MAVASQWRCPFPMGISPLVHSACSHGTEHGHCFSAPCLTFTCVPHPALPLGKGTRKNRVQTKAGRILFVPFYVSHVIQQQGHPHRAVSHAPDDQACQYKQIISWCWACSSRFLLTGCSSLLTKSQDPIKHREQHSPCLCLPVLPKKPKQLQWNMGLKCSFM